MKWYDTGLIGGLLGILPFGGWFGKPGLVLQAIGLAWLTICTIKVHKENVRVSKKLESLTQSGGTQS